MSWVLSLWQENKVLLAFGLSNYGKKKKIIKKIHKIHRRKKLNKMHNYNSNHINNYKRGLLFLLVRFFLGFFFLAFSKVQSQLLLLKMHWGESVLKVPPQLWLEAHVEESNGCSSSQDSHQYSQGGNRRVTVRSGTGRNIHGHGGLWGTERDLQG